MRQRLTLENPLLLTLLTRNMGSLPRLDRSKAAGWRRRLRTSSYQTKQLRFTTKDPTLKGSYPPGQVRICFPLQKTRYRATPEPSTRCSSATTLTARSKAYLQDEDWSCRSRNQTKLSSTRIRWPRKWTWKGWSRSLKKFRSMTKETRTPPSQYLQGSRSILCTSALWNLSIRNPQGGPKRENYPRPRIILRGITIRWRTERERTDFRFRLQSSWSSLGTSSKRGPTHCSPTTSYPKNSTARSTTWSSSRCSTLLVPDPTLQSLRSRWSKILCKRFLKTGTKAKM